MFAIPTEPQECAKWRKIVEAELSVPVLVQAVIHVGVLADVASKPRLVPVESQHVLLLFKAHGPGICETSSKLSILLCLTKRGPGLPK